MTADDLRALSAAATPGPWETRADADGFSDIGALGADSDEDWGTLIVGRDPEWGTDPADAELIVWLRNHADALADLIDAAEDANMCDLEVCSMCRRLVDALTRRGLEQHGNDVMS